jgi:hypothetical protein
MIKRYKSKYKETTETGDKIREKSARRRRIYGELRKYGR